MKTLSWNIKIILVQAWGQCKIRQIITIFGQISDKIWIRHRFGFYYFGKSLRYKQNNASTRNYESSRAQNLVFSSVQRLRKVRNYRADIVGYRIFSFGENPCTNKEMASNLNSQLGFSPTRTRTRTTTFSDHLGKSKVKLCAPQCEFWVLTS